MGGLCVAMVITCAPAALIVTAPRGAAVPELAASAVLHTLYNLVLVAAYDEGDFSQTYPIARGTAPPLVAIVAAIAVGEELTAPRIAGLLCLSAGLFVLAAGPRRPRAIGLALLTGVAIAAYTVVDGVGVRHSGTPLGYATWLFLASGFATALVVRARSSRVAPTARATLAALFAMVAYGLVLWAQTHGKLAVVAGLRETSVVFAALIGAVAFHEPMGLRRVFASVLVATGAVALALG